MSDESFLCIPFLLLLTKCHFPLGPTNFSRILFLLPSPSLLPSLPASLAAELKERLNAANAKVTIAGEESARLEAQLQKTEQSHADCVASMKHEAELREKTLRAEAT